MENNLISRLIHHLNIAHRLVANPVDSLNINGKRNVSRKLIVFIVGSADFVQHIIARNKVKRHHIGSGGDIIFQYL